jgi:hypothetical protein
MGEAVAIEHKRVGSPSNGTARVSGDRDVIRPEPASLIRNLDSMPEPGDVLGIVLLVISAARAHSAFTDLRRNILNNRTNTHEYEY